MLIEDGQGSGRTAGVNSENRLKTITIASSPEHHANHEEGLAFNMLWQQTPTLSDPSTETGPICFLYIKNLSDLDMIIEGFDVRMAGTNQAEILEIVANDGEVPVGGNSNTPVNLNLGSAHEAEGIFLSSDEITGMTYGVTMLRYYIESSNTTQPFNFEQDVIVPKNNTLTIWATNGGNQIDGTLVFFMSDPAEDQ